MIAFVRGEVAAVTLTSAVLEVGGVGLELMCTPGTLATLRVGRPATLTRGGCGTSYDTRPGAALALRIAARRRCNAGLVAVPPVVRGGG